MFDVATNSKVQHVWNMTRKGYNVGDRKPEDVPRGAEARS